MDEVWKVVAGFESYDVSNLGHVRNAMTGYIKRPSINLRSGYLYVQLRKEGSYKTRKIHRLVAEHFIENPDCKPIVDHINRVRTDNRLDNLRWASAAENSQNRILLKKNKLGVQYVSQHPKSGHYWFKREVCGVRYQKSFNTLVEAMTFRDEFNRERGLTHADSCKA